MPGYIKANFDRAWDRFDINADGFIKAEETHTFMRSLMGKLNKFALAPGSLSDIGTTTTESSPAPTPVVKKVTPKLVQRKAVVEEEPAADASIAADAAALSQEAAVDPSVAEAAAVELEAQAAEILPWKHKKK